ncbi:Zn-dependent protease with chaperone function [Elusimicrobium posterum]|uniref:M48 family metalloprotease n=1 Tax=Elusimicrobium posterum TaxID=3116653 RepID=UPI003C7384B4
MKTVIKPEDHEQVIESNINGSGYPVLKEFMSFAVLLVVILVASYMIFGLVANIYIDNVSYETKLKLESSFAFTSASQKYACEDASAPSSIKANNILQQILAYDSSIQNAAQMKVCVLQSSRPTAFVVANGDIFISSSLLKHMDDEQQLWFVLAHEAGHYANRDVLKKLGRSILMMSLMSLLGSDMANFGRAVDFADLDYSRKKEFAADKYASNILIKQFGTNKGGVDFFEKAKEEDFGEILHYFSTHPSDRKRVQLLKSYN